jgi:hypothetical protein
MFPFLPLSLSLSAKKIFAAGASANLGAEADTFAIISDGVEEDEYYVPKDDYSGKWSIFCLCMLSGLYPVTVWFNVSIPPTFLVPFSQEGIHRLC